MNRKPDLKPRLKPLLRRAWQFARNEVQATFEDAKVFLRFLRKTWRAWRTRERRPVSYPLFVPHLIRWVYQQAAKWLLLVLALACFLLSGMFALSNPVGVTQMFGPVRYDRLAQAFSPVLCGSFFVIGLFLVSHFRLLRRKSRPQDT